MIQIMGQNMALLPWTKSMAESYVRLLFGLQWCSSGADMQHWLAPHPNLLSEGQSQRQLAPHPNLLSEGQSQRQLAPHPNLLSEGQSQRQLAPQPNLLSEGRRVQHSAKMPPMGSTWRTSHWWHFLLGAAIDPLSQQINYALLSEPRTSLILWM